MQIVSLTPIATETLHLLGLTSLTPPHASCSGQDWFTTRPADTPEPCDRLPAPCPHADLIIFNPDASDQSTLACTLQSHTGTAAPRLLKVNPRTIEAMLDTMLTIGYAIDQAHRARELLVALRARLWQAQERVNAYTTGPSVACILTSHDSAPTGTNNEKSILIAGDWLVQCIERAGFSHPLNPGKPTPTAGAAAGPQMAQLIPEPPCWVSPDRLARSQPDLLCIVEHDPTHAPSPALIQTDPSHQQLESLARTLSPARWKTIPAVQHNRLYTIALSWVPPSLNHLTSTPRPSPTPALIDLFEQLVDLADRLAQ